MRSSAWGLGVSVSVAVLFPGVASVTPAAGVTVAGLTRLPVAPDRMLAVTIKGALPAASRLTLALMLPVPLAGPDEPAEYVAVQLSLLRKPAGNVSVSVDPVASLGPALVAMIV